MDRRRVATEQVPAETGRGLSSAREANLNMSWINLTALWKIVVFGLIAGAGLPALFAGRPVLAVARAEPRTGGPRESTATSTPTWLVGGSIVGMVLAAIAFLVILAAIGWCVYEIYTLGHPAPKK